MPTSYHRQISTILDAIIILDPKSVLDIGVGFGKYGVLCREYLELWDGREDYHTFTRQIDGIEAFEDYLTPLHRYIYNHVYIGKAQDVIKTLTTSYDLVLLIDVLEHLREAEGRAFLKYVLSKHQGILISTPKHVEHQDEPFHNPYETHVSEWSLRDLRALAPAVVFPDHDSHIIYLGTRTSVIKLLSKQRLERWKQRAKHLPFAKQIYHLLRKTR